MVNDGHTTRALTGDTPGTAFGGVTSGPSICASGAIVAYAARLRDTGESVFTVRVVVLDRSSGAERCPRGECTAKIIRA